MSGIWICAATAVCRIPALASGWSARYAGSLAWSMCGSVFLFHGQSAALNLKIKNCYKKLFFLFCRRQIYYRYLIGGKET